MKADRVLIVGRYTLYKRIIGANHLPYFIRNTHTHAVAFQCSNIRTARAWLRNNRTNT